MDMIVGTHTYRTALLSPACVQNRQLFLAQHSQPGAWQDGARRKEWRLAATEGEREGETRNRVPFERIPAYFGVPQKCAKDSD